jgi:AraC-like DNA-binding protein
MGAHGVDSAAPFRHNRPVPHTRSRAELWNVAWQTVMGTWSLRKFGLGCSFVPRTERQNWYPVVEAPNKSNVVILELEHGFERARTDYNLRCLDIAWKSKHPHIGRRAGFVDLFVPAVRNGRVQRVLVCGPLLEREPTVASLRAEWESITGHQVKLDDDSFLRFVRSSLDTPLFEKESFELLQRHLQQLAAAMAGSDRQIQMTIGAFHELRGKVPETGMWHLAAELVDPEGNPRWTASYRQTDRSYLGLAHMPDHVLTVAPVWPESASLEQAELLVRTHRWQRACADFAMTLPNTISGRVGAEAAFFLTRIDAHGTGRARTRLIGFAERVQKLARNVLKANVACGFSDRAVHGGQLPARHAEALWAVLWGLHKGQPHTFYEESGTQGQTTIGRLYHDTRVLYESFASGRRRESGVLAQQIVKDVLWISSGSLEVMRSHFLEILWELVALTDRHNVLERRTAADLLLRVNTRLRNANSTQTIANAFIEITSELINFADHPQDVERKTKLERARRVVDQAQNGSALDLVSVSRKVGMSRAHFARCFRAAYGVTFGEFVVRSKVERSKNLLRSSALSLSQVCAQSGWGSTSYFHQAFKRRVGMTPDAYRRRHRVA